METPKFVPTKWLFIALGIIAFFVIVSFIYRYFFLFDKQKLATAINDEAKKYGNTDETKAIASKLITESVEHILSSYNLTQQVKASASYKGVNQEEELVRVAVKQCESLGYIKLAPTSYAGTATVPPTATSGSASINQEML